MSDRNNPARSYLERFDQLHSDGVATTPDWLLTIKRAALARFEDAGFPDPRHEEWKYTNVRPLLRQEFAAVADVTATPEAIAALRVAELDAHLMVFVGGRYRPELSSPGALPAGARLLPLAEAIESNAPGLAELLGTVASDEHSSFAALNTAFVEDGVFLDLERAVVLERPVYLLFAAAAGDQPTVAHPRVVVRAGELSEATVIEHYVGSADSADFTNAVTEIVGEAGSRLTHYLLQEQSEGAYHIGSLHARQHRDATLRSFNVNLGGRLVRNDLNILLAEPGAGVDLNGLFMADGRQHVDNHTRVHHAAPRTNSSESYRGVADGRGRGVFKGRVLVDRGAQRIEAHQSSANLLLSENAEIDTKPELEIYADDVVCSHGATVGQLDDQALYYLRSRAIDEATARGLLVFAFADEVIERMGLAPLRERLEGRIVGRLPDSEMLRQFV